MIPMTTTTPRLRLRPFSAADFDWLHPITADPRVTQYASWGPNTPAATRAFLADSARCDSARNNSALGDAARDDSAQAGQAPTTFRWAVTLADGTGIGSAELEVTSLVHRRASVGYLIDPAHWGHGYATEVARDLVARARTLDLHRVEATCHPENAASARVLEKAGLSLEGRLRDHLFVRGAWRDSLLFARIIAD